MISYYYTYDFKSIWIILLFLLKVDAGFSQIDDTQFNYMKLYLVFLKVDFLYTLSGYFNISSNTINDKITKNQQFVRF